MNKSSKHDPLLETLSDEQRLMENQRIAAAEFRARTASEQLGDTRSSLPRIAWAATAACAAAVVAFIAFQPAANTDEPTMVAETQPALAQDVLRAPAGVSMERAFAADALAIPVTDLQTALSFYQAKLGFSAVGDSPVLERNGLKIMLLEQSATLSNQRPIQATVSNLDELAQALQAAGIQHKLDESLRFEDADGNAWVITE